MLRQFERPLTAPEMRRLRKRASVAREGLRSGPRDAARVSAVMCAVLGVVTWLASDAPAWVVAASWTGIALVITALATLSARRDLKKLLRKIDGAVETNRARVVHVRSDTVVELEEIEDEGACYAFRLEPDRILFVDGQEFYASKSFPNDDFELVHVDGAQGQLVDLFVKTVGKPLKPARTISAEVKRGLELPEHLAVVSGSLDDLERAFARPAHA